MKIYSTQNVYDAALDRIRYLFNEFPNIIIGFSGGKDSTVVYNLAKIVAKEKNRLPLKVMFLDQEAEWQCVIDYVRMIMSDKDVEPLWFQMPLRLFNATSHTDDWLYCWEEGKEWIREKENISIKNNRYNCDRFADLFAKILEVDFKDKKTCYLSGVRCEESPARFMGLTYYPTYKWITWGRIENKKMNHYAFYPIYDWSYTDVWKAIENNNWKYCKLYDYMYQYGVPIRNMRVSNVHHETAVRALFFLQEIEPDNWNKIVKRLNGINTAGKLENDGFIIKDLPYMFKNWKEYRDYLLENLINGKHQEVFKKRFEQMDKHIKNTIGATKNDYENMYRVQISMIMTNDYNGTKQNNWRVTPKKTQKGRTINGNRKYE